MPAHRRAGGVGDGQDALSRGVSLPTTFIGGSRVGGRVRRLGVCRVCGRGRLPAGSSIDNCADRSGRCWAVLGAGYLDVLPANVTAESIRLVTELTLALILFADSSTVELRQAEGDVGLPLRLLGIGLPLTMALGALAARVVFPSISWSEAALIAAILAPRTPRCRHRRGHQLAVPLRIRRALTIESGLNDGIATPFVTVFLAVVVGGVAEHGWAVEALAELARGAGLGIAIGYGGGRLVRWAKTKGWTTPVSEQLVVLSLAFPRIRLRSASRATASWPRSLPVWSSAQRPAISSSRQRSHRHRRAVLVVRVWVIFGAAFVGPVIRDGVHLRPVSYAVVSLTLVRMVPVAISLVGERFRPVTIGFIGWLRAEGARIRGLHVDPRSTHSAVTRLPTDWSRSRRGPSCCPSSPTASPRVLWPPRTGGC